MLAADGALEHVIEDVYAPVYEGRNPLLRAQAARRLLPKRVSASSTMCGESAAWVHLGGAAPARLVLISDVFRRGRASGAPLWQTHQSRLEEDDVDDVGGVAVTTPLRTASDLFLGLGTLQSRRPLDLVIDESPGAPSTDPFAGASDESPASMRRWRLIADLLGATREEAAVEELVTRISRSVTRRRHDRDRLPRIRSLVIQCASRRLPTVR